MASDLGDGDYLGAYRRFFVDFLKKVNPDDPLPIKTSGHDVTEGEIVGEIIHMTLQYLDQQLCPPSLQCYIVQLVIEEIKATCRKQPESCGFRQEEKTYAPLKLMHAVTGKVNEICQRYLENSRLALLPPPPSTPMPLATAFAIRNNRRKMEDRHVILHDLNTIFNIKDDSIASYYAVFDGHAGYQAAVFCATHLHQYLAESRHYPTDPERALRDAFLTTDASFIEKSRRQTLSSGTTAVCALILNRKLYVAWAGDSQAALAKRGNVTQLVNSHKPDRNDERERVEEMGGTVMHLGIWRVNGNLAVSRAIGDAQYKPYVTGDPEIRCINLDGHEDFLIIACDGLWDCVTENEAATLVYRDLYRDPYDYVSSSQRLVEYAKSQGSIDNITVIVVFLATPRQIASRSTYGNPLLADVQMNNMDTDNRYLSNANGQYDVNTAFVKQQTTGNNGTSVVTMEEDYENYDMKSSNGKRHANGDKVADYDGEDDDDDLGPETDVDAVDDISEPVTTLADVSRQLFTEKSDPSEIFQNDECTDDDAPPSSNTKSNQRASIPDADNVGDSEDSEDEWNYYRIDPNKEKENEAGAAGFSTSPKVKNEIAGNVVSPSLEEHEDTIELEEKCESSKKDTDSSSDSESDREIFTNPLIDSEISADAKLELNPARATVFEAETETIDEQEEKKIRDEEGEKENEVEGIKENEEEGTKENEEEEGAKENEEEDMDFQLNPNAAEFVPVSPTLAMPRIDLDMPISGSPLKQTPPMDDIKIPSRREFQDEIRHRPHEIEEKAACTNGQPLDDAEGSAILEKPAEDTAAPNLDDSEISSTKAEFGDESSFLTTSEFHRTEISTLDGSYAGSYGEFDDSSVDPMTKSFGPGDFMALGNTVDLNAVHDLTDVDLMADDEAAVAQEADVTETKNRRNAEIDTELENIETTMDPCVLNETENPLDSSTPVSFHHSPVSDTASNLEDHDENVKIPRDDKLASSELLPAEAIAEDKRIDKFDDFVFHRSSAQSQESPAISKIDEDTSVTTKLLEMDLEDRGSQDCEFEKCNEKLPADETMKDTTTTKLDEPMDYLSSPVPQENLADTFAPAGILSIDEATRIDEFRDIDKFTESLNDDLTSSQHSSVPDVLVMHNPLSLEISAPSANTQDNLILDDDSYRTDCEILKGPDSPEVGLSPLTNEPSNNPFNRMEFGDSSLYTMPQENDITTSVDEREDAKILATETPLERNSPLIDENPFVHESSFVHVSPPEDANPLVHKSPPKDENLLELKSPSLDAIPMEHESFADRMTPREDEASPANRESPTRDDDLLEHENMLEPEETANVSSSLKLSESLQEFTGLEQQLNPEKVSNGLAARDDSSDIRSDVTRIEIPAIISEVIESEIAAFTEVSKPETNEEKTEIMKNEDIVAATVVATVAAVGTAVVASKTTKAKPAGKVAQKIAGSTRTSVNKSTPTSPTKPVVAASARAATKKAAAPASSAARPNKLETAGKASLAGPPSTKTSAATTAKVTSKATKTTARLTAASPAAAAAAPKAKTSSPAISSKSTTSGTDKKPTSNGESTKFSVATTNKSSSTNPRLPSKPLVKSSSSSGGKTIISTATTTTTMSSAGSRPKTTTTSSRLTSKSTNPTTGSTIGATTQRPKTAPSTNATSNFGKSRLATSVKSPITDKQIKETANKQISSSRTATTTTNSKTSRISGSSSTVTSTRRLTATKSATSTGSTTKNTAAAPVIPPPIRKPASMTRVTNSKQPTTNGKVNTIKTSSSATSKTDAVIENGVCTAERNVVVVTSATTITTTSNEEDIPKKDVSPVEPPTDNQLITTAD